MNYLDVLQEFQNLKCSDEIKCATAARIYIDLKDVINLKNIKYQYNSVLDLIYFQNLNDDETIDIFIPACRTIPISFTQLDEMQNTLKIKDKDCRFKLAICDPSSTILYYRLKQGIY